MRRLNVRRIMIAVTLGVIVNVLVAWSPYLGDRMQARIENPGRGILLASDARWPTTPPPHWPKAPQVESYCDAHRGEALGYTIRTQEVLEVQPSSLTDLWPAMIVERSGWPLRALVRYEARVRKGGMYVREDLGIARQGLSLPKAWWNHSLGTAVPLPLMPLWPGFMINTVLYGSLAWALISAPSWLKRRRRIGRGLCIHCAYPLTGGDVCPECGTAVASAAKPPAPAAEPDGSTPV